MLIRMARGMVDLWCQCHARPPKAITLDIDDSADTVHGHQHRCLFQTPGCRCSTLITTNGWSASRPNSMPIHVYDAETGHCVVTILRPGKTPDGREVRPSPGHSTRLCLVEPLASLAHPRRLVRRIRQPWPNTVITIRGDGHSARREAMQWCEENGIRYLFGLSKNAALDALVDGKADAVRTRRAVSKADVVRDDTETLYAAKSSPHARRLVARFAATGKGFDTRYVVTTITHCGAQWLYDSLYGARGAAENLIKRHQSQRASDRTRCRSPRANQMRLILHTAADWLMLEVRSAIPRPQPLASGAFSTIRPRLLKIAVRIKETASRVRLAFASNCPDAALFHGLPGALSLRPT
jgi:hypothetical protein